MTAGAPRLQPPPARLLDLSRLISRVGRGPWTGVDRVEAAYLARLLDTPEPLFALVRTRLGFALLDRAGTAALADRLFGRTDWGQADVLSWIGRATAPERRAAESDLRRLAIARCRPRGLPRMLRRHLPAGTSWVNTGHSNLTAEVFAALHALPGGRASVLLHDTIPLDFPLYQRPGTVAGFARKMALLSAQADLVICNSEATRQDALRHFTRLGRVPELLVAPLGVAPARPDRDALPPGLPPSGPYFVALGTIEPRKNHAFLLDIWAHFAATLPKAQTPALVILGARGWNNDAVFARLDAARAEGLPIHEIAGLDDGAVAALLAGARGLVMPSLAEGFGLPPAEALALGTPVIANPLPVYWEILGNNPIYAPVTDMYLWAQRILELAEADRTGQQGAAGERVELPTWAAHFNLVLKVT